MAVITVAMALIPLFWEVALNREKFPSMKLGQRLLRPGKIVIGLGMLLIVMVFFKDHFEKLLKLKAENPVVDISNGPEYDFQNITPDTVKIMTVVKNYKSGRASNFVGKWILVEKNSMGIYNIRSNNSLISPKSRTLLQNAQIINTLPYTNYKSDLGRIMFLYFRLDYTNDNGDYMEPIANIYPLAYPNSGATFPDIDVESYKEIRTFLENSNVWNR